MGNEKGNFFPRSPRKAFAFQFWQSLAIRGPSEPAFGLLGWNFGDFGNPKITLIVYAALIPR
jgi:hypothetical protein